MITCNEFHRIRPGYTCCDKCHSTEDLNPLRESKGKGVKSALCCEALNAQDTNPLTEEEWSALKYGAESNA